MLHPSTQQLIRKLCELTDAGHIAWKEGERQSSRFDSEGYVVEVEAEPPTLRLLRGDGRELERADAADLAATAWPDGQPPLQALRFEPGRLAITTGGWAEPQRAQFAERVRAAGYQAEDQGGQLIITRGGRS